MVNPAFGKDWEITLRVTN